MKMNQKKKGENMPGMAKRAALFSKDIALDAAGELLDLGVGTLVGLGTLGTCITEPGEFNPRRKNGYIKHRG
jgi:hypothetical protein